MKRIVRIFGLAMVLTALLVVSIAGTVFAHNGHGDGEGNGPIDGSGPWEPGPNGPYAAQHSYAEPGPHGEQNCIVPD